VTVWGISVVRDEADIIEATVSRMLREVDHVLVADNRSVDGTDEILRSLDGVTVLVDPDPAFNYHQAQRMTVLAALAAQRGARWVVPFDADEVWVAHDGRVGDVLDGLQDEVLLARAPWLNHVNTDRDPPVTNPLARMVYRRREFDPMPKVACRTRPELSINKGNHNATYRGVPTPRCVEGLFRVHHFPIRSAEQFVRKVRQKAETLSDSSLPEFVGVDKRPWVRILEEEGEDALVARVYQGHWWFADPDEAGLVLDPCP
jgi:hypothetical protein